MSINSRRKGAKGELELVHKLSSMGLSAYRSQQRTGLYGDADIEFNTKSRLLSECKRVEKLNLSRIMERAAEDAAPKDRIPILFSRRNHDKWIVSFYMDDMWEVIEELIALRFPSPQSPSGREFDEDSPSSPEAE